MIPLPTACKAVALPIELHPHTNRSKSIYSIVYDACSYNRGEDLILQAPLASATQGLPQRSSYTFNTGLHQFIYTPLLNGGKTLESKG